MTNQQRLQQLVFDKDPETTLILVDGVPGKYNKEEHILEPMDPWEMFIDTDGDMYDDWAFARSDEQEDILNWDEATKTMHVAHAHSPDHIVALQVFVRSTD